MERNKESTTFKEGDPRASECGRKGGKAPKATGSKTGATYKYKGFIISWDRQRHLWKGKDGATIIYERSHHKMIDAIRIYKQKNPDFIEIPVQEEK